MVLSRRYFMVLAIGSAIVGGITGSASSSDLEVDKVTYGGSAWLGHYPVWVGIKKGIFKDLGLNVNWESFNTSSARMASLAIGEIEFGGTGSISAIALMAAGSKAFYLVGYPDSYASVEGIITSKDIKNVADLKGKKIGLPFATSSHMLALDVLEQNGIDPNKDVTLINLPAGDTPSALKSGQVDAVVTWTPAFNVLKADPQYSVLVDGREFSLYKDYKFGSGPDVLMVNKSFADTNPKATAAFLEGFYQSSKFITENPKEATDILVELTQLDHDEQIKVLEDVQWHGRDEQIQMLEIDGAHTKGLQELANMLVKHKQIDTTPQIQNWVKSDVLR